VVDRWPPADAMHPAIDLEWTAWKGADIVGAA
jgi:hypothetical protein